MSGVQINDSGIAVTSYQEPPPAPTPPTHAQVRSGMKALDWKAMETATAKAQRQKKILVIQNYYASPRFGRYLEQAGLVFQYKDLEKLKMADLSTLLTRIRTSLAYRSHKRFVDSMVLSSGSVIEQIITPFYDIDGFGKALLVQDDFLDCVEELKLDWNVPDFSPGKRIIFIMLQTALMVHSINARQKPQVEEEEEEEDKDDDEMSLTEADLNL